MISSFGPVPSVARSTADEVVGRDAWNSDLERANGHILQSWEWGEFKAHHGWGVERLRIESSHGLGLAQVLFKSKGPVSLAYVPRGPALAATGDTAPLFDELRSRLDAVCRRRRALSLILERDDALGLTGSFRSRGFVRGSGHYQPGRTVKVPLLLDDDALLAQMHQKNRYSVRLAVRRGVTVERGGTDEASIDSFYELLTETAGRNRFGIHDRSYYDDFMRIFDERALMLFAMVDGRIAAGLIAVRFGAESAYIYGGSSTIHRADGAAFILQYEAMRWARDAGSLRYDLWGIPAEPGPADRGDSDNLTGATQSAGEDMRGLLNFKTRFGGDIVDYPPMMERRYVPVISWLAGRIAFDRA